MAKRGYKLQEFVAHAGNVNCLSFGKKNCLVFITGGDDQKVNLWSFGRPTPVVSLCGHTSPVESASFDSSEVSVVAGSSSGAIKLWDLGETKMVRTHTGHRSYCTAVEFHPFGEFFASGSMDANLKIWDIRKKGCIHTYKGHTRGISTIRFTPDGRWVVSGGYDNVVKVWDLTAGKLLHDFTFHEGHVRSIEFHPLEFLLATGSADKTVKFWDLETFEMIGSTTREATGLRSMAFHPDGRTLFCGLDDSLKVYSWEPIVCHDSVSMGWSTLGGLCVHDGKLLGGAHHENMVAIWVADILKNVHESEGSFLDKEDPAILKSNNQLNAPESDSKGIKTIYVDCVNSMTPKMVHQVEASEEHPSVIKETSSLGSQKHGSMARLLEKSNSAADKRPPVISSGSSNDSMHDNSPVVPKTKSSSSSTAGTTMVPKQMHSRRLSASRFDMHRMSSSLDSLQLDNKKVSIGLKRVSSNNKILVGNDDKETTKGKNWNNRPHLADSDVNSSSSTETSKVVHGRTRSLVERFERKENAVINEMCTTSTSTLSSESMHSSPSQLADPQNMRIEQDDENALIKSMMLNHETLLSTFQSRLTKLQVIRHFWEKNDINGAIKALRKLPDHSIQADVVGILVQKKEIITLDLFSCLLPMLEGLIFSTVERHATVSLEMLLKLVAVFGAVVRATVSSPPLVGVDLHAEERLECCKKCDSHLRSIQQILPKLMKRDGDVAKYAQQLNIILQQS